LLKKYLDLSSNPDWKREPYSLVICEKPAAALRIAQALGTASLRKASPEDVQRDQKRIKSFKTPVFKATDINGAQFVICSAIGHLYGLADPKNNRSVYPVFDVKWVPIIRRTGAIGRTISTTTSQQIIDTIAMLSRKASRFIHACDYDQEGELIGYNILQYTCKSKYEKSLRAKFSTLTADEIRTSFENLLKPRSTLAEAGRTRHTIDFIYGVNLSRALTQSFKASNLSKKYYNLSIGRVQGPTLAFVVDREIEIRTHIPVPYWNIQAEFRRDEQIIDSRYYKERIRTLSEARMIAESCKEESGRVIEVTCTTSQLKAPAPFNLGDLQREAYRVFKFSPSYTLTIAEKLYLNGLISYPRTSSQKLSPSIDYKKIIRSISELSLSVPYDNNNKKYKDDASYSIYKNLGASLMSEGSLSPNQGSKTDPAHPAIYPTGERPKGKLEASDFKIFDLIIKRFFATFGKPALSRLITVTIQVKKDYLFRADSRKTIDEGWLPYYRPYISLTNTGNEKELANLQNGDILQNISITIVEKFSQPPSRFNQATLLQQMEKDNIGTKATRSDVISTLFKRNYISNISAPRLEKITNQQPRQTGALGIQATELGFEIIQSMRNYVPEIISSDLTRFTETQLYQIESGTMKSATVLESAIERLNEALVSLKKKENEIGHHLTEAITMTRLRRQQRQRQRQQTTLGTCPVCTDGLLKIIRSSRTKKRFVGCSNYTSGKCKAAAPLPQTGSLLTTGKKCSVCKWPILIAAHFGRNVLWKFCINGQCPTKKAM
jgi:DNA topoisomerase I